MFRRFLTMLIFLTVLLSISSCNQSSNNSELNNEYQSEKNIDIDWVNFIKLNGIQYVDTNFSVDNEKLGPKIDEVNFKLSGNISDTNYEIKDGDAAYLEKGTPIYSINGYNSTFRIAVKDKDQVIVYQVFSNPNAKVGSDIADIFDKVDFIRINNSENGEVIATITEEKTVKDITDMLLNSPVEISSDRQAEKLYLVAFYLKDGSEFKGAYSLENNQFTSVYMKFMLPPDFQIAIEEEIKLDSE
ncbi:hypothetical protein [Sporosalibacterium faouarense]|uniref:hypothetical protein n=1 Tax=Sporosalibacterium faouarense TaxID=516123 RepID=UPI00141D00AF|nr:hypothetical protein [Sporosalibacterium faouarense]MTI48092.1 hypothetical protein [Bacillota bacterium]